jgi:hypothetical protein
VNLDEQEPFIGGDALVTIEGVEQTEASFKRP